MVEGRKRKAKRRERSDQGFGKEKVKIVHKLVNCTLSK